MNKDLQLSKRLKQYAGIAAAMTGVATTANAQVVYTDVSPDETYGMGQGPRAIDMNSDSAPDFALQMASNTSSGWYVGMITPYATSQAANDAIGVSNLIGYAYALSTSYMISAAGVFIASDSRFVIASDWGGNPYGYFTSTPAYMGVRFNVGSNTHYGWIRLSGTNGGTVTATLYDYAYESTPNVGIAAGDMGVGISENFAENVSIFAYNNVVNISMSEMPDNGVVEVLNTMGQVVYTEPINDFVMNVNLPDLSAGVYVVNVIGEGQTASEKIYIR